MLRHRVTGPRPTAVLLTMALLSAPARVSAATAPPAGTTDTAGTAGTADTPDEPAPLDHAQRLYQSGRAKFETADYSSAIAQWTEAYSMVPETEEGTRVKVLLIYNIATARQKAFDVSRDPAELRQAKILLGNFEQQLTTLYGEGERAETERAKVRERIAQIDEQLDQYEREHPRMEPAPTASDPPSDPSPPPLPPADGSARGLIIGGAVSAGVGLGALGLMAAGLGMGTQANDISALADDDIDGRRRQFRRGRTGNTLALAGGIAGGVLLVTGATLLGLGLKRRTDPSDAAGLRVSPQVSPRRAGLVLRGRF